jgi:hypothetical protein
MSALQGAMPHRVAGIWVVGGVLTVCYQCSATAAVVYGAQLLSWLAEMFSEHVEGVAVVDPAD